MSKKVTLTITVNDDKAINDLGIGIIAKRDGMITGYSNLTASELEKLSIVFNTFILHKEDTMSKEEIKRAKHILRRGTTKDVYDDCDNNYSDALLEALRHLSYHDKNEVIELISSWR